MSRSNRPDSLRRAEEAAWRSATYLAEAQRLSQTGSWAWDVRLDRMVYWSDELYRIYGFDPADGVPSVERALERVHPDDRERGARTEKTATHLSLDEIAATVELNVVAAMQLTALVLPGMRERRRGRIVNIASGACAPPESNRAAKPVGRPRARW